jgi:hypothetical protein
MDPSKKKVFYFVGIAIVMGLFIFSLLLAGNRSNPSQPVSGATGTQATITIPTAQGDVPVRDITQHPAEQVQNTDVIEKNDQYSITYFSNEKSFLINILAEPVQKNRDTAESAFLKDLGVDYGQACKLTVSTYVLFDVNQNLAGQDYGLSFCPSGKQF